ncbi:MAG: replication-associated recombination protein A [Gaiellales bacterium]
MSDLFSTAADDRRRAVAPLPERLRPDDLDLMVGQEALIGPGRPLRRAIEEDRIGSMILFGPPGTGKTTIARIVAQRTGASFEELSAVDAGKADVRAVTERARDRLADGGRRTILFLDEIHRFTKAQQDALLPLVESGLIILIGATTESPHVGVISALLSRCTLYELVSLEPADLERMIDRGAEALGVRIDDDARAAIARAAGGDGRASLALLEAAAAARPDDGAITEALVGEVGRLPIRYDREGDLHYDAISAFIKSMRGSDPDAALWWMHTMLEGGEDPRYVARRMIVFASEDVGNADPRALPLAVATAQAIQEIGMPEGRIPLAQCVTYLALAPKSNAAYAAGDAARAAVREHGTRVPPDHLRDGSHSGAKALGRGVGYRYPHAEGGVATGQRHLPEDLAHLRFYEPTAMGFEARLGEILGELRAQREVSDAPPGTKET